MKIGTLGFPSDQLKKLEKILNLSRSSTLALTRFDPLDLPDVLLVFGEEPEAFAEVVALPTSYRARVVPVSKQRPLDDHRPHIKLPFISSRVLRTLEAFTPLERTPALGQTEAEEALAPPEPPVPAAPVESPAVSTAAPEQPAASDQQPPATAPSASADDSTDSTTTEPACLPAAAAAAEGMVTERDNPFRKYEAQIEAARREQAAATAAAAALSYSVLVVDDSHPMQQMLAKELQQMEHPVEIDFADDGETALEKAARNHYDFIFLDIMMPGIDGFETCTRLRQMPALKKTPIIMLSSKTSPLDEVKGIMAGSSTYLTKPIDHVEFQKVIKRVSRWVSEFRK